MGYLGGASFTPMRHGPRAESKRPEQKPLVDFAKGESCFSGSGSSPSLLVLASANRRHDTRLPVTIQLARESTRICTNKEDSIKPSIRSSPNGELHIAFRLI